MPLLKLDTLAYFLLVEYNLRFVVTETEWQYERLLRLDGIVRGSVQVLGRVLVHVLTLLRAEGICENQVALRLTEALVGEVVVGKPVVGGI